MSQVGHCLVVCIRCVPTAADGWRQRTGNDADILLLGIPAEYPSAFTERVIDARVPFVGVDRGARATHIVVLTERIARLVRFGV